MSDETEYLIDQNGTKYYVLKNSLYLYNKPYNKKMELIDALYYRDKFVYRDKLVHRENGPAVEYSDGNKEWYQNGLRHRENGPAVEYIDGYKAWYINGKRHREDGQAIEYEDGSKGWYIDDLNLTETEYKKFLVEKKYNELKADIKNEFITKKKKI